MAELEAPQGVIAPGVAYIGALRQQVARQVGRQGTIGLVLRLGLLRR